MKITYIITVILLYSFGLLTIQGEGCGDHTPLSQVTIGHIVLYRTVVSILYLLSYFADTFLTTKCATFKTGLIFTR